MRVHFSQHIARGQAGWWQRNLWGKRNLGQAGGVATRFCQVAPPTLPPLLPNLEGLGLRFIKRDDSFTYMILIKKKQYNPDTGVCKGLDDSHMSGGKVSSLWFKVTLLLLTQRSIS